MIDPPFGTGHRLGPLGRKTTESAVSEFSFVCPQCKGPLTELNKAYCCAQCDRTYPVVLGIPDFRIFPDPYISIEDDRHKAKELAKYYGELSFPEVVSRYWEMTPGVPEGLVREFTNAVVNKKERAAQNPRRVDGFGGLLEVGCGAGGFLAAAAPSCDRAVGVDIAFRWLLVAKKNLEESGIKNATLVCACGEFLPFPDGIFDEVAAEDVLDHARDQAGLLRESRRVLKQQTGTLYLSTPNRYSLGPDPHVWVWGAVFLPPGLRDPYIRFRKGVPYGPIHPVSYAKLRRLLKSAGFEECNVELPGLQGLEHRGLSPWHRFQARMYERLRGIPMLRYALRLVGPSFQVVCHKPKGVNQCQLPKP